MQSAETSVSELKASGNVKIPTKSRASLLPRPTVIALFLVVGGLLFGLVSVAFPLFFPGPELLVTFPPDEIVTARERAFSIGRIGNAGLALGLCMFVSALLIPFVAQKSASRRSVPSVLISALISTTITCIGTLLAFLLMEYTTPNMLGISRTFMAHWLQFAAFGAGIGWAAGTAIDGNKGAMHVAQQGAVIGFITATVFDIACSIIPRAQVDNLFPGGVIWGNRDPIVLGLWIAALMVCAIFTVGGVRRYAKNHP